MKGALPTLSQAMVGFAIVLFALSGMVMFNYEISTTYGMNTTDYSGINNTDRMNDLTQKVYTDIQGATETPFGAAYYGIKGGWDTFKLMFALTDMGSEMYTNTTDIASKSGIPIPPFVTGLIILMLSFVLIFAAFNYIGRVNT